MPSLFSRLTAAQGVERSTLPISFDDWVSTMTFGGSQYPFVVNNGNTPQDNQEIGGDFSGYVERLYKSNGIVYACMAARARVFSEARFQFRRLRNGRPGDLFGNAGARAARGAVDERHDRGPAARRRSPTSTSPGTSTRSVAATRSGRLRPDWVTIIAGSRTGSAIDAEPIGYAYQEGGPASGNDPEILLPEYGVPFRAARAGGPDGAVPWVLVADTGDRRHSR